MKQRLAILGSTGSIGVQTLDIVRENPDFFEVRVLTANSNWQRLAAQAREFDADTAVIAGDCPGSGGRTGPRAAADNHLQRRRAA